jgi:RNA-binding protein NOB1
MDAVSAAAAHGTAAAATAASRAAIAANAAAAASQTEADNSAAAPSAADTEPAIVASEATPAAEPETVEVPQHEEHESDDEEDVKEAAEAAAAAAASTGAAGSATAAAPSVDSNGAVFTVPFESKEATTAAATGAATAEGDDNDGEGSWITPSNLHQHRGPARAPTGPFEAESAIACVTTDYAMQNVLLQLGARLLSLRGRSIRSLRSWMKKCHACDALSADLSREFCDRCGHHSMIRVQVTVNRAGLVRFWHGTRHLNLRGTIYSIPRPKGGRHANNLLLSEDMVDERIKKGGGGGGGWAKPGKGQDKTPNQMFQDSIEFGIGRTGPGGGQNQFGYGKRNPNAHSGHAQKKKGKK